MPPIPLGSGVTLSFQVYAADGITGMDATNPVVTLRRPTLADVVYSGASVVHDGAAGSGLYHVAVPKTDAVELGRYPWIVTADSPQGVLAKRAFDVIDPWTPSLLTIDDARQALGKTARNLGPAELQELQLHVDTANERIETMTGPAVPRTVTDTLTAGDASGLDLTTRPGPGAGSFLTLVSGTLAGVAVNVAQFQVVGRRLTARTGYALTAGGAYVWVYRVGRQPIPSGLFLAGRILVQHLWDPQRPQAPGFAADAGDMVTTGYGFAIPNRVAELVRPYEFGPGIA